jgi:protein-S-isoprenylcysteine O-methyltransferase Ste14
MSIAWRAFLAVLALPCIVAMVVPVVLVAIEGQSPPKGVFWIGLLPTAIGILILLSCVSVFIEEGRGTLAPWDPPKSLVIGGLYRWVRNPMYIGVLSMLAGWAICWRSVTLAVYAGLVTLCFHLRVVIIEEPRLRSRFGDDFGDYAKRVHRWVPRLPPVKRGP